MKKIILFIIALSIVLGLGIGTILWFISPSGQGSDETPYSMVVNDGDSLDTIAQNLERAGVIKSAIALRALAKIQGTQGRYKRGTYEIPYGLSLFEVQNIFLQGQEKLIRVTIPDGWTLSKVANLLDEKGIVEKEEFLLTAYDKEFLQQLGIPFDSAQGFLYPDTYFMPQGWTARQAITHMTNLFWKVLGEVVPDYEQLPVETLREAIIIASIVEREYVDPDEARLMSSVFYNRLKRGQRLESCATVVYVMTEEEGLPHPTRLLYRDLDRPSPYNTYRAPGLPPGPIASPGRVALEGAFYPAQTDYLYFVLKDPQAKQHHFSKSFSEHNQAAEFYLKQL